MKLAVRGARLVAMAIALGWLAYVMASWLLAWNPADAGAYLDAADRLRSGQPLYQAANPEAHEVYRYAPWFAYMWIPFVGLPRDTALHAWSLLMLGCSVYATAPLFRHGTPAGITLGALCLAFLAETAMFGNAHPIAVAMLVFGLPRRSAPIWIGVAASLKLVPILFVIPWLLRGEWGRSLIALVTAGLLFLPMLFFDLTGYVANPGTGLLSIYAVSPVLWLAIGAMAIALTFFLGRGRDGVAWAGVAGLSYLLPPRVVLSYLSFAAPAVVAGWDDRLRKRPKPVETEAVVEER
jgi:hypothetical protein